MTYTNNVFAQNYSKNTILGYDTLTQTGYLVIIHKKDLIKDLIKNVKRKKENKNYELILSLSGVDVSFISFDTIKEDEKFLTAMNNHYKNNDTSIYTLYESLNVADFKFLRGLENKFLSKWPDINNNLNYYELAKGRSEFCFQICLITAQWVKIKVPSLQVAYDLTGRKAKHLKKDENYYEIYVLKEIVSYDPNPNLKGTPIKLWRQREFFTDPVEHIVDKPK